MIVMATPESIALIGLTFILAGLVKGVIGLGLPTVSLAILTTSFGLIPAIGLMIVPSLITNLWQTIAGGELIKIAKRFWPMMFAVVVGIWVGGNFLVAINTKFLTMLLGVLLSVYSLIGLTSYQISVPEKSVIFLSPFIGGISGILTGLTGTYVVPSVLFLQSIKLDRSTLIQTMGMLFTVSTITLAIVLDHNKLYSIDTGTYSLAGVVPALIGMAIGKKIRKKISGKVFTNVFFTSLLILGVYISGRALI